ncbi:DUF1906 domain-containing protein [Kitasatospora arboriphila]|uniref:Rv2525c-like glycoside hydrolase-like domain-containing protein n=1 Tax=Kitasatospora arboriphila TaxID=258052 RepID=A0ABP4E7U0_9ACTN
MRSLGTAALAVATSVLLLATAGVPAASAAPPPAASAAPLPAAPRLTRTVLADPAAGPAAGGRLPAGELYQGPGFDACTAPPLPTMQTWWDDSPYGAVGIYVSGSQRGCTQSRLTADWVAQSREMGWRFVPTHVGLQAPCSTNGSKPRHIDPARAVAQGQQEAAEAVVAMRALGFGDGSPVYLDIEAYPRGDSRCSQAVTDFAVGWTQALHAAGHLAGFYSSAESGIADLAAAARAGSSPLPDAVWYARWDDHANTTDGAGALNPELWTDHGRIHQHRGNVQESYGGNALTVDRDELDSLVG